MGKSEKKLLLDISEQVGLLFDEIVVCEDEDGKKTQFLDQEVLADLWDAKANYDLYKLEMNKLQ